MVVNGSYTDWRPNEWSTAGSIPGLGLFNIFINDMEETTECTLNRIADVAKLGWSELDHLLCEAAGLGLAQPGDEEALEAPNSVSPLPP